MAGGRDIRLRAFEMADLEPLAELIRRTIDTSYAGAYPEEAIRFFKDHHPRQKILQEAAKGTAVVLELDGRIIGTGTLAGNKIKRVFVDPAFQNQGLGRRIMQALEDQARAEGIETVQLHASLVARRFYDGLGYRLVKDNAIPLGNGQRLEYHEMNKRL